MRAKVKPDGFEKMSAEERAKVNPLDYESGDTRGATGLEHAWESYLRGQRGWEKRVVDARGRYRSGPEGERLIDAPDRLDPIPGRDLRLSIDSDIQQALEKAKRAHPPCAVGDVESRNRQP